MAPRRLGKRHRLPRDAQYAPRDSAVPDEARGHELRGLDGNREGDALAGENGCRVHPDDTAAGIGKGPARVAGVERGIRLDDVAHEAARTRPEGAADGTDDAGRHRRTKAVRAAEGHDKLPDAEASGVA